MMAEGNRLIAMASELLNTERIESGRDVMKSRPVAIRRLFSDLAASFAAVLERKRAEIRCDVEGVESCVADREKMKQVLMNLVDNSLTFCDEGCVVELMARRKGREIEISVSGNGWGTSEEDLPHLTEMFYRGKQGAMVRGTGLGLSSCSEVVLSVDDTFDAMTSARPYRKMKSKEEAVEEIVRYRALNLTGLW
jgi:signal transduction histidine kinase